MFIEHIKRIVQSVMIHTPQKPKKLSQPEAAIDGVQASVDDLILLSGGWCLKIEIVISFGNI